MRVKFSSFRFKTTDGRTVAEVRDATGHASVSATSVYTHAAVENDAKKRSSVEVRLLRLALIGFQVVEPLALVGPIPAIRQPDTSVWAQN